MYGYSTNPDAEKHGYDGLRRIIPTAVVARGFHCYPPISRSILTLQKNGTDAETCAVIRAERRADEYAELGAVSCAVIRADTVGGKGAGFHIPHIITKVVGHKCPIKNYLQNR